MFCRNSRIIIEGPWCLRAKVNEMKELIHTRAVAVALVPVSLLFIAIALAHARSYEAVAQWRRERGARYEAERLDSMAEALHHFIGILKR